MTLRELCEAACFRVGLQSDRAYFFRALVDAIDELTKGGAGPAATPQAGKAGREEPEAALTTLRRLAAAERSSAQDAAARAKKAEHKAEAWRRECEAANSELNQLSHSAERAEKAERECDAERRRATALVEALDAKAQEHLRVLHTLGERDAQLATAKTDATRFRAGRDIALRERDEARAKLATAEQAWRLLAECVRRDWLIEESHPFIRSNPPPKEGA